MEITVFSQRNWTCSAIPTWAQDCKDIQNQKNVQKSFSLMDCTYFYCTTWKCSIIFFIFTLLLSLFTSLSLCKEIRRSKKWRTETFKLCILPSRPPRAMALAFKFCTRRTREPVEQKKKSAIAEEQQWMNLEFRITTQTVVDSAKTFQKL